MKIRKETNLAELKHWERRMGNGVQQYLCSAAPIPVTKDLLKDEEGIIRVRALREAESPPGAGARGGCH